MILRTTCSTIIFFFFAFKLHAQTSLPPVDSLDRHKWEISTDVLWLFNRNTIPYSAMLRIHKENNTAYRLRVAGKYSDNTNAYKGGLITGDTTFTNRRMNLFFSAGKEWQKQYGRFRVIYGSDIFVSYYLQNFISTYSKFQGFFKDFNVGISPFIGGQYFVHRRISLSTEAHLNLAYKNYRVLRLPGDDITYTPTLQNDKYIRADLLPFYVFNVSYHF